MSYEELQSRVRADVERLSPGAKLPPAHELAARYEVTKHMLRTARGALVAEGLVVVRGGYAGGFCRAGGEPELQRVIRELRDEIEPLRDEAKLPPVDELAARYEVTAHMLRTALRALVAEGFVVVRMGRAGGFFRLRGELERLIGELRQGIEQVGPGAKLPTRRALAARHEVSQSLLRKALEALQAEGVVVSRGYGAGWYKAGGESELQRLIGALRAEIAALDPGTKLVVPVLAESHGVHEHLIRSALRALAAERERVVVGGGRGFGWYRSVPDAELERVIRALRDVVVRVRPGAWVGSVHALADRLGAGEYSIRMALRMLADEQEPLVANWGPGRGWCRTLRNVDEVETLRSLVDVLFGTRTTGSEEQHAAAVAALQVLLDAAGDRRAAIVATLRPLLEALASGGPELHEDRVAASGAVDQPTLRAALGVLQATGRIVKSTRGPGLWRIVPRQRSVMASGPPMEEVKGVVEVSLRFVAGRLGVQPHTLQALLHRVLAQRLVGPSRGAPPPELAGYRVVSHTAKRGEEPRLRLEWTGEADARRPPIVVGFAWSVRRGTAVKAISLRFIQID